MFTGLVEAVGRVVGVTRPADGKHRRLRVACEELADGLRIGASVAVDGCCVTVTGQLDEPDVSGFTAELMGETVARTTLGEVAAGQLVNLERPVPADGRFGGHLVQGHVDAVGWVVDRDNRPDTTVLTLSAPVEVGRHLVPQGSVAVAGVSLTVIDVRVPGRDDPGGDSGSGGVTGRDVPGADTGRSDARLGSLTTGQHVRFQVGLIPHTATVTTLGILDVGDRVNLEADMIAKYVAAHVAAYVGDRSARRQPEGRK